MRAPPNKNDFIEIFNRATANVDVSGWSVQYASSAGTSWQVTNLSGTIAPGQYYLIQESAGAGGAASLPDPDATGTINMSATSGKVVLTNTRSVIYDDLPRRCRRRRLGNGGQLQQDKPDIEILSNSTAALCTGSGRYGRQFGRFRRRCARSTQFGVHRPFAAPRKR